MKNLTLFLLCSLLSVISYGQTLNTSQNVKTANTVYQLSAGVNAVNNLSLRSPLNSPGDWAFSTPLALGIEARSYYDKDLALAVDAAFNKIKESTYYSLDASVKYYLNEWIPVEDLEFLARGGLGVFNMDHTTVSANAGGGALYWFNDRFGIRLRSMAKFAFNARENLNTNNHFQHNLELVFVL